MRAILFDFDGTIADTIPAIAEGVNLTMQELGLPKHTEQAVLRFINYGARELIRQALPESLRSDASFVDRALETYNRLYGTVYHHTRIAYDGMRELIADFHKEVKIGVLSNKQDAFVKRLCRQVLLPGTYDAVVGYENGKPAKPDPYLSNKTASLLQVAPEDCIMVGDSDVDLMTAKNANMIHVGVSWGYRSYDFLKKAGATRIARTTEQLREEIQKLLTSRS